MTFLVDQIVAIQFPSSTDAVRATVRAVGVRDRLLGELSNGSTTWIHTTQVKTGKS